MGPAKGRHQALADQFKFISPENKDEAQLLVSKIKKYNLDELHNIFSILLSFCNMTGKHHYQGGRPI